MIVDCHTQVWDSAAALAFHSGSAVATVHADAARHIEAVNSVDRAIVLGFKSAYLKAEIPNRYVSEYVRRYSSKLIGFAGVDPTDPAGLDELRHAQEELNLKGAVIAPSLQNFHPSDTRAMRIYAECSRRGMPVLFDQNHRSPLSKMEFSKPVLLDEVAREFPELRLVISHMGYPWLDETIALLAKHRRVYADVAGLLRQPWRCYNALLNAYEYGVMDKLLFGSDFPYRSPAACIEALYSINQFSGGTNLTPIPREQLRGIVERDALTLLGIESPAAQPRKRVTTTFGDDE